jgi:hypothetical protein
MAMELARISWDKVASLRTVAYIIKVQWRAFATLVRHRPVQFIPLHSGSNAEVAWRRTAAMCSDRG